MLAVLAGLAVVVVAGEAGGVAAVVVLAAAALAVAVDLAAARPLLLPPRRRPRLLLTLPCWQDSRQRVPRNNNMNHFSQNLNTATFEKGALAISSRARKNPKL